MIKVSSVEGMFFRRGTDYLVLTGDDVTFVGRFYGNVRFVKAGVVLRSDSDQVIDVTKDDGRVIVKSSPRTVNPEFQSECNYEDSVITPDP